MDTNLHQQSYVNAIGVWKAFGEGKSWLFKKQRLLKERYHMLSAINFNFGT